MKNFFSGMRPPTGSRGGKASQSFLAGQKKGAKPMTAQERYQAVMEEKLSAGRKQNAGHGFSLPGTAAPEKEKKELSKNMKLVLEQMAMRKAKKEAKKNKKFAKEQEHIKKKMIKAEQIRNQQEANKRSGGASIPGTIANSSAPAGKNIWGNSATDIWGNKKDDGGSWW